MSESVPDNLLGRGRAIIRHYRTKKSKCGRKNPLGLDIVPVDWGQTGLKRMWRHLLRLLFTFLSKKAIITCPRRKEEVKKSAQMAHMAITELHVECGRS